MVKIALPGPLRKRMLREVLPKPGNRAAGFVVQPIREKFETVGYRVHRLDKREAIAAHSRIDGNIPWGGFRNLANRIDAVATDALASPGEPGPGFCQRRDRRSECRFFRETSRGLQDWFRAGASFLATVSESPAQYGAQLRRRHGLVAIDSLDRTIGPARKRLYRELGLAAPGGQGAR